MSQEKVIEVKGEQFEPFEHLVFSKQLKIDLLFPSSVSQSQNLSLIQPGWFRKDYGKDPTSLNPEIDKKFIKDERIVIQYFVSFLKLNKYSCTKHQN